MNLSQLEWGAWTYAESIKSEREKQISYSHTHTHICNLEIWYWLTYLQGKNTDTDVENGLENTAGEWEGGTN